MLVMWKEKNALTIHQPGKARTSKGELILPGYNDVDDKVWENLAAQPGVKFWLDKRKLVTRAPSKDNKKANKGLLKFDIQETEEIIRETYSKPVLKKWKSHETRADVRGMIEEQIKVIDNALERRDLDDPDHQVGPKYDGE